MAVSIEETCRQLDAMTNALKTTMAEQEAIARKGYHREFGIFMPSLFVSDKYPEGDVVYKEGIAIYRDAHRFINNLQAKRKDGFQFKASLVARYCFQGWVADWFFGLMKELQDQIAWNLDTLCTRLCQKYEQEWRSLREQQQQEEQARIKKEQEEARLTAFACRRCPAKFPSNTKLHQHIQDHHQKKAEKPASETAKPTPSESAELTPSETAVLTTPATPIPTSRQSTPTSLATPKKPISWAEIASRPVLAPKPSRLPVPTPKTILEALETVSVTCPPTPPPTPPQKPTRKHQKPYLTIEDLFEMFAEKPMKTGLQHTKKTESSPKVSYQARITSYFKPAAANQSKPISQGLKTPNPRSFQQHTPAESNRPKSIPPTPSKWSEKSAILPYKTSTFSRRLPTPPTAEISSILPYKMPVISGRLPRLPAFNAFSTSSRVCRICNGQFGSNNSLHRHLRAIHFGHGPRHCQEKPREPRAPGRNIMARRSLTS